MSNTKEEKFYSLQKLVNTYKLLEKRKPPCDQEFVIYAYYLFSEPQDGIYGKQIYLGSYPTKRQALDEVNTIIKETGHDCIYVTQSCHWEYIDEKKRPDRTLYVDPKTNTEDLEKQFRYKILKEADADEERELISKELEEQAINELDPNTIEHYAHNWFNAIKNKANYEFHKQEMEHYEKMYNQRVEKIQTQYNNQPELEKDWLDTYEKRLKRRKEEDIFLMLKSGHDVLVDAILSKEN